MTWVIRYRLEREQPLDRAESATLLAHVAAMGEGWQRASYRIEVGRWDAVVARGETVLRLELEPADVHRLLDALTALCGLVSGTVLVIEDSQGWIGWEAGRLVLRAPSGGEDASAVGAAGEDLERVVSAAAVPAVGGMAGVPSWAAALCGPIPDVPPPRDVLRRRDADVDADAEGDRRGGR